jgi:hypothetical protein
MISQCLLPIQLQVDDSFLVQLSISKTIDLVVELRTSECVTTKQLFLFAMIIQQDQLRRHNESAQEWEGASPAIKP